MLVFGGFVDGGERTNDLWTYSFAQNTWTLLKPKGLLPKARASHSAVIRGNTMIIFGGCDLDNEKLNDLWIYDLLSNTWQEIQTDPVNSPLPRSGHSASMAGERMMVFGGIFEVTKELNDLMAFDFTKRQWVTLFEELGPAN